MTVADWIKPRVLELVYTSNSLKPFALDLGYSGEPFAWDPERRFILHCELNAAFFHLYGINREDADYIMETFPIVKRHDEQEFGEYRTKKFILEFYDRYANAIEENQGDGFSLKADQLPEIPEGVLPPVPALPTIASITEFLSNLGIEVENNRKKGGGLWVYLAKSEFGRVAEHLEKSGVGIRYYPNGRSKHPGEQYELDWGKKLK